MGTIFLKFQTFRIFYENKSDFKSTEIKLFLGQTQEGSIQSNDYTHNNSEIKVDYYRNKKIYNKTEFMNNLLIDLIDKDPNHCQVEKTFREEYCDKCGLNYLLSFLHFHIVEQCGNFKDQSLKNYENN